MKPYADNIVTFRMLYEGYIAAYGRFVVAAKGRDAAKGFHPLFETLNWAVALDDRIGAHWAPEGKPLDWRWRERVSGAEVMKGVRWARNSVHHQWSDTLVQTKGARFPMTFPVVFFEWVWRPARELPDPGRPDSNGEIAYEEHLEGRPARVTLAQLSEVFDSVRDLLEPRHWTT